MGKFIVAFISISILFIIAFAIYFSSQPKKIVGNEVILSEIDRLLLPVGEKTIAEQDFDRLRELTEGDELAEHEVEELIVLTSYQEYSHVGHGLGSLYRYIKSGNEPVCPGHALAHYYVFMKYDDRERAEHVLEEARTSFEDWNQMSNSSDSTLFATHFESIDAGNVRVSDEEISTLANAPCVL